MTPLEVTKLRLLRESFGHLTKEEALRLAIKAEATKNRCAFSDPARMWLLREQEALDNMALLLEKELAE